METITRFGVSIEPGLLKKFDRFLKEKGYDNRSEAIRDLVRKQLITETTQDDNALMLGTFTMVYDHHTGHLTEKLLDIQHDHTDEILTTTHIHIDHHHCLEILILKGKKGKLQHLADTITALKGIKHGELVLTKSEL